MSFWGLNKMYAQVQDDGSFLITALPTTAAFDEWAQALPDFRSHKTQQNDEVRGKG